MHQDASLVKGFPFEGGCFPLVDLKLRGCTDDVSREMFSIIFPFEWWFSTAKVAAEFDPRTANNLGTVRWSSLWQSGGSAHFKRSFSGFTWTTCFKGQGDLGHSERWWLTEVTSIVTMHFTIVRCCWYPSCKAIDVVTKYGSNMDASLDFWSLRDFDGDPFTKAQFLRRLMLQVWFGGYSFAASWIQQLHAISMIQLPPQVIYKNATYRSSGWTEVGW